jgi:hypothetical protein
MTEEEIISEDELDTSDFKLSPSGRKVRAHRVKVGDNKKDVDLEEGVDLRKQLDKHSEAAIAANKAGDDEKVKYHMAKMNAIKTKMAKSVKEEAELDEAYGRRDDAYTRDYKSSVSGMGKHQSAAYRADGGANDEGWDDHKPAKQADHPHAVHINGKKWKTFGSQSHATNVARKIKGATVHREEFEQISEVSDETKAKYIKAARNSVQALDKSGKEEKRDNRSVIANRVYGTMSDKAKKMANEETEVETCPACGMSPCKCEHNAQIEQNLEDQLMAELNLTDEQIDHIVDSAQEDDFIEEYDDEEFSVVDEDTGEELEEPQEIKEQALMEVLSRVERIRARVRFAKTQAKRERKAQIALKMRSSNPVANKRARRLAIKLMKNRLLRGRDINKISIGEKERIERVVQKRKAIIGRVAMKLVPRIRQIEKARLSHTKFTKGGPNVAI